MVPCGDDQRRPDCVDVHVIRSPLERQRLGDHLHGALGGRIARIAAVLAADAAHRRKIDDLAGLLRLEDQVADLFAADHHTGDVDVHQLAPVVDGKLECSPLDVPAKGVDQNVDGPHFSTTCLTISATVSSLVTSQLMPITSLPVSAATSLGRLVLRLCIEVGDHDLGAQAAQSLDQRLANAARAAHHQGDLAIQTEVHAHFFLLISVILCLLPNEDQG